MLNVSRRNLLASTAGATFCLASQATAKLQRRADSPITDVKLHNLDASRHYAAPSISYGHAFADGDIPPGGSVAISDSNGNPVTVQMDAVSLWSSGSPRFSVLSHDCAETFPAGGSKTYVIASSMQPPNNTPSAVWGSSPEATMAANTNFTVEYASFDARANTYTVSLNAIFSTFSSYPWGTHYPLGGWERTKVGPVCIEWHAWQYLINDSTLKPQGYVRCDIWIKAWSPTGPFEIDVRTSQPNMWNAVSEKSERYNKSPGRWATNCVIRNGSTIVQNAGGPGDHRSTTIPKKDFDTSVFQLMVPQNSLFPQQGIVFVSTGNLPAGIAQNTIYWLAYTGNQSGAYIATERVFVSAIEQGIPAAWAPSTTYAAGAYVVNGSTVYICTQAGESAATGGPVGTGHRIPDGTCKWDNASVPFTDQGSGTITAYPLNVCFPSTAWTTGDMYGNPLWNGPGRRPPIFPGHDLTYLTTRSKFAPCYNIHAGFEATDQSVNVYAPNQNFGGITWYQDTTGDGAGDQRIGYVNGWGVTTLFNPADSFYLYGQIQAALCFSNYPYSYMTDERGGMPFCANNGPKKNGKRYRNLPDVLPDWAGNCTPGKPPAFGVGNWLPWSAHYKDQSGYCGQYYVDPSHMPAAWQIAYLKTGRPCFLEQGIHMGNTNSFMLYITEAALGNRTYYCVVNTSSNTCIQERAWAWALRSLCQALYIAPANHAFQPVLSDYYNDNAEYQALYYTSYVPPEAATFGFLNVFDHGSGEFAPWERSFLFIVIAMEVWRGGLTGSTAGGHWKIMLDYMNAMWGIFSANLPSSLYYSGTYNMAYSPNSQGLSTAYQSANDVLNATYNANNQSGLMAPYPSSGLYDANVSGYLLVNNFGENCTWYGSIMRAALKMVNVAEPTNTTVAMLKKNLISQTASATGISAKTAGIQWYGQQYGNIQNYHTFAIF